MTMSYAENGTDPVYTFSAGDPEGVDTIVWSLRRAADAVGEHSHRRRSTRLSRTLTATATTMS